MSLQEDQSSDQTLTSSPPNGPSNAQGQSQEQAKVLNPCCCNMHLHRAVAVIASVEIIWTLCSFLLCLIGIFVIQDSIHKFNSGTSTRRDYDTDYSLRSFWQNGGEISLIALTSLHGSELIAAMFLVAASSRRVRSLCYAWIVTITLLSLGIIGVIVYNQSFYSWSSIVIVPFRIYFIWVVGALGAEIAIYPKGPPPEQNGMYQGGGYQGGAYYGRPAYGGGYGYVRPYYGGYGYPGYYGGGYYYGGGCY